MDYTRIVNFLMTKIYAAIFQKSMPRVLSEMWDLQKLLEKREHEIDSYMNMEKWPDCMVSLSHLTGYQLS